MGLDCQVCGKPAAGEGFVEGARVALCEVCSEYSSGFQVFKTYVPPKPKYSLPPAVRPAVSRKPQGELQLAEDYGKRIMQAREKQGLSRKDLAKKLLVQEKELEGFEQQKYKPGEATIKKLEFALGISLLEQAD
ncbi:MAG TPA: multiprotein-bridging factor 1 family protein [Candidatus Norongarragalinales archaeon]|nr:multiprotein-bridging factor 1 family protein [Candidatus Norongarragalinales archaeon]